MCLNFEVLLKKKKAGLPFFIFCNLWHLLTHQRPLSRVYMYQLQVCAVTAFRHVCNVLQATVSYWKHTDTWVCHSKILHAHAPKLLFPNIIKYTLNCCILFEYTQRPTSFLDPKLTAKTGGPSNFTGLCPRQRISEN